MLGPVNVVGAAGMAFTVTTEGKEVAEQPPADTAEVTVTAYEPAAVAVYELAVAPAMAASKYFQT